MDGDTAAMKPMKKSFTELAAGAMKAASPNPQPARSLGDRLSLIYSSGFGAGYFPVASGTFGSLCALPFAFGLSLLEPWPWLAAIALYTAVAVVAAHRAGKLLGETDAKEIVSDEFAGQFITLALLPFTWQTAVVGFFLFRFFDIFKPWPASYFDKRVRNGFGTTFDDVFAGLYARLVMQGLFWMGWLGA